MAESEKTFFKTFQYYSLGLAISITLIFFVLYAYFLYNFNLVKNFFNFFELTPLLRCFFAIKMEKIIIQSTLTDIVLIFAGIFGIFYLLWVIENKGFMAFEGYDIYQKHFQTAFYVLALFNFIFLTPIVIFLFTKGDRIFELLFIIFLALLSLIGGYWFQKFAELIKNYDMLLTFYENAKKPLNISNSFSDGKTALKFIMILRTFFSRSILILMFLTVFYSIEWNFNLLTILYIILVFLACYFIISSVTKIPITLVNIVLNTEDDFKSVFITEESTGEYIVILQEGNLQKKVMKNSIKYIELVNPSN